MHLFWAEWEACMWRWGVQVCYGVRVCVFAIACAELNGPWMCVWVDLCEYLKRGSERERKTNQPTSEIQRSAYSTGTIHNHAIYWASHHSNWWTNAALFSSIRLCPLFSGIYRRIFTRTALFPIISKSNKFKINDFFWKIKLIFKIA